MIKKILARATRWVLAFSYSLQGLSSCFKTERAFQEEVILLIIAIPIALWMPISILFSALLICSVVVIMIAELTNSAIETVVNRISTEQHPLSKRAKDIGSSIVLMTLLNALLLWSAAIIEICTKISP